MDDILLVSLLDAEIVEEILRVLSREGPLRRTKLAERVAAALRARGYAVGEDRVRRIISDLIAAGKLHLRHGLLYVRRTRG